MKNCLLEYKYKGKDNTETKIQKTQRLVSQPRTCKKPPRFLIMDDESHNKIFGSLCLKMDEGQGVIRSAK